MTPAVVTVAVVLMLVMFGWLNTLLAFEEEFRREAFEELIECAAGRRLLRRRLGVRRVLRAMYSGRVTA